MNTDGTYASDVKYDDESSAKGVYTLSSTYDDMQCGKWMFWLLDFQVAKNKFMLDVSLSGCLMVQVEHNIDRDYKEGVARKVMIFCHLSPPMPLKSPTFNIPL